MGLDLGSGEAHHCFAVSDRRPGQGDRFPRGSRRTGAFRTSARLALGDRDHRRRTRWIALVDRRPLGLAGRRRPRRSDRDRRSGGEQLLDHAGPRTLCRHQRVLRASGFGGWPRPGGGNRGAPQKKRRTPMSVTTAPTPRQVAGVPFASWAFGIRVWIAVVIAL